VEDEDSFSWINIGLGRTTFIGSDTLEGFTLEFYVF
jgi:hypothetical protein